MTNFETVEEALKTSQNSMGSADRENEKYLESTQGKLDQLQAAWQSFGAELAKSEFVNFFIESGTQIISVLDKMTDVFGSLGMVMAPVMATLSRFGNKGKLNMPSYVATHRMMAA